MGVLRISKVSVICYNQYQYDNDDIDSNTNDNDEHRPVMLMLALLSLFCRKSSPHSGGRLSDINFLCHKKAHVSALLSDPLRGAVVSDCVARRMYVGALCYGR